MLTFYAIEYDRPTGDLVVKVSVGYNKKNEEKNGLAVAGSVSLDVTFSNSGEKCGYSYLDYFDSPEQWLVFPSYGTQILISESDD